MHRNTYLSSPAVLTKNYAVKSNPFLRFAGQITGVEGYMESAASGIVAAMGLWKALRSEAEPDFTRETLVGAMADYVTRENANFQPMNGNFGLLDPLPLRIKKKRERYEAMSAHALEKLDGVIAEYGLEAQHE